MEGRSSMLKRRTLGIGISTSLITQSCVWRIATFWDGKMLRATQTVWMKMKMKRKRKKSSSRSDRWRTTTWVHPLNRHVPRTTRQDDSRIHLARRQRVVVRSLMMSNHFSSVIGVNQPNTRPAHRCFNTGDSDAFKGFHCSRRSGRMSRG
jgi:hypothetical protein